MKTKISSSKNCSGQRLYVKPLISVQVVELEQSIVAGSLVQSIDSDVKHHWEEVEEQTHDVRNNYWN
ncbi:hypothetical protein ACL9RF_13895 [Sphingobacterium sp. Mn56C]|uniref:hypothetical protein n=1 Tax=Sphingobacterium sp. Mn56C TaxID=3395261 RepID=UPI003BBC4DBE